MLDGRGPPGHVSSGRALSVDWSSPAQSIEGLGAEERKVAMDTGSWCLPGAGTANRHLAWPRRQGWDGMGPSPGTSGPDMPTYGLGGE